MKRLPPGLMSHCSTKMFCRQKLSEVSFKAYGIIPVLWKQIICRLSPLSRPWCCRLRDCLPELIHNSSHPLHEKCALSEVRNITRYPEVISFALQELGKQPGSTLAPRLKIRGEEYEDLDEIISRRVSACNDLVNDLLASNKVS